MTKPELTEQARRFVETARALDADESEAAFKAKLVNIARHRPQDEARPAKPLKEQSPL